MPAVLKEIKQGVAMLTLNREEKINSINREMALQLQQLLRECEHDDDVKVIYLTGRGKSFCAGQDLAEASDIAIIEKILPEQLNPLISLIRTLSKPVVGAVKGVAAGAGASLALCCDIVVASSSATFIQAFSKIGLIPDSGVTYILPRTVGWQKATAYMMLAEKVSATEAERVGMIYKVFSDDTFDEESFKIAIALSHMPSRALALTKEALNRSLNNSFDEQLKTEEQLQMIAGKTKDFADRITGFLQKKTT
ncbi:MAG TPA: enoyl-CoA hydratase-related protein [Flavitalea sp.]|nr:enoyl-CoA hydratase-related protein [Flavitalea sp.]